MRAAAFGLIGVVALVGCTGSFANLRSQQHLVVCVEAQAGAACADQKIGEADVGSPGKRLPITFTKPTPVKLRVEAHRADGTLDDGFNGWVRLSVQPGAITVVTGKGATGRNVQLAGGVADAVTANLIASYGDTRVWAEDAGYGPVDPNIKPPPQCSDGLDNDGNGLVDFPNDPGCAFANDDTETIGTYAAGASNAIYFALPRVADVRGITADPTDPSGKTYSPGTATAFPHDQVSVDTGYRVDKNIFEFSVVVTRIASDGFYVTDLNDTRAKTGGSNSIFAFTFNAPPKLSVCDRLTSFTGTSSDFFGFTEMNFPTWGTEEYYLMPDGKPNRACMVPDPYLFDAARLADTTQKFRLIASLVRLVTGDVPTPFDPNDGLCDTATSTCKPHHHTAHVGAHFGPGFPAAPDFKPTDSASNCDLNGDAKVDFSAKDEGACANNCEADNECVEYSSYAARGDFRVVLHDDTTLDPTKHIAPYADTSVQVNASTAAEIDPLALRGQPIRAFTGTLRYFSGGSQFTIEARCPDDIVLDPKGALPPMDQACVFARTASDNNSASN
jgi:hypothetical protein